VLFPGVSRSEAERVESPYSEGGGMKTFIFVLSSLLAILFVSVPAYPVGENNALEAAAPVPRKFLWVVLGFLGLGYAVIPEYSDIRFAGMTMYLSCSYNPSSLPWLLLTARVSSVYMPLLFGGVYTYPGTDYGVLAGVVGKTKWFHLSLSTGISITGGSEYFRKIGGEYETVESEWCTVGIPVEVQFFYFPSGWVGLGMVSFANINTVFSVFGWAMSLRFGRVRAKEGM